MKFQRIGALSLTKQKGYDPSMPSYHSPPERKGVYGFPWPYFEWFLLGSQTYSGIKSKYAKFEYIRDNEGQKIHWKDWEKRVEEIHTQQKLSRQEYEGLAYKWADNDGFIVKPKRIRIFEYKGEIWHHLGSHAKPGQIYEQKGCWYLSSIDDYQEMLNKEKHDMIVHTAKWLGPSIRQYEGKLTFPIRPSVALDHMEIFIAKKI